MHGALVGWLKQNKQIQDKNMNTIAKFQRNDMFANKITETDRLRVLKLVIAMLDYYRTHSRGVNEIGACVYLCEDTGAKCAVGMYLDTDHPSQAHLSDGSVDDITSTVWEWDKMQPVNKQIDAEVADDSVEFHDKYRGLKAPYNVDPYLDAVLQDEVRGLPHRVWQELQNLHDKEANWTKSKVCEDGQILSATGVHELNKFLERWGMGADTITAASPWFSYLGDGMSANGSLSIHPINLAQMERDAKLTDTSNKAEAEAAK